MIGVVSTMAFISITVSACGGGSNQEAAAAPDNGSAGTGCPSTSDPIVAKAKEEGKVVMSGPPTDTVRQQLPKAFQEAYGVALDYIGTSGKDNAARLQSERAAGIYSQDVFVGGGDTMTNTYHKQGWLGSLTDVLSPTGLEADTWRGGKVPFVDSENSILSISRYVNVPIVINTDEVKPDEIKNWKDLLEPKWKGKIAMIDPRNPGGANYNVGMFTDSPDHGEEFVEALYKNQEPILLRDSRLGTDDLAKGKYPIALALGQLDVDKAINDGLPIEVVLPELLHTTSGFGLLAISDQPPHPNAAKLLTQWLSCQSGNKAWNDAYGSISTRADVEPAEDLSEWQVPDEEKIYFDANSWGFLTKGVAEANGLIARLLGAN